MERNPYEEFLDPSVEELNRTRKDRVAARKKQKKAHLFLDSNDRSKSNWNLVSCDEIGEKDMKIKCQPRGGFVITIE